MCGLLMLPFNSEEQFFGPETERGLGTCWQFENTIMVSDFIVSFQVTWGQFHQHIYTQLLGV